MINITIILYYSQYYPNAILFLVGPNIFRKNLIDKAGHPIPPGPPLRYAFLRQYPERALHVWGQKYGSIFSVWMAKQLFVVINDPKVARDLLVVHGANFSSRWSYFMKNQTILAGGAITAAGYNDSWRKHRRIAMQMLAPKAIEGYSDVLDVEARVLIRSLYDAAEGGMLPINPAAHVGRFSLNNMLALSFGFRSYSATDPLVVKALELGHEFMQLTGPWSNIIDFITPLQWIPTRMRSRGRRLHTDFMEVYGGLMLELKRKMDAGEEVPDCLVKSLFENQTKEELSWQDMCFLSIAFTTGGVHSTSGIIQWFLALMPSHPDVQARAHEELDKVVGRDRWPTAEDEQQLPYLRAIIKELLRFHSPFWMGIPHCSEKDFVYNDMYIPGGTVVVLNVYNLHHNEERYPNSSAFIPERFLGDELSSSDSSKLADPMKRDHWAFGAGRRICPGMAVAEREIWLVISRLLWAFNISGVAGEPISLEEYEGNSGRTPLPFRVKLEPRHANLENLMPDHEPSNTCR
ncbi:hypothetical protein M422DRAFT_60430 [Sphaerobolus stellatus SS14]|uniref:Cytochrome P450 n=1 Tax=Sphaerobolus stellatus (strain SS14) TaxID=990650 RepID=A0A0C9UEU7_SPHS4|nr:hypothetical protein M422DRAFT_60430 [Sphaerobolus stellatus SS14]